MKIDGLTNFLNKEVDTKRDNSFINNFITEIKNNLIKKKSFEISKDLPIHSILNFAKYEGNFAVCFDNISKKIYYIPKENILGTSPEPGEILKINSPGKFYVDYTGIPLKEILIEKFLNECEIAN